jgi:hypothetical protein
MKRVLTTVMLLTVTTAANAQTRKKQITELHWGDATIAVIAASDTTVHLEVTGGSWAAVPQERVDYLREWLDSTATVMAAKPALGPGEYVELTSDQGPATVKRKAYADSSSYVVTFHGPGGGVVTVPKPEELAQLVTAMQTAERETRAMSGVTPSWDRRRR